MNESKTLKEIAVELLEKYKTAEEALIYECSGLIEELEELDYECGRIRKQIEKAAEPKWVLVTEQNPLEYGAYLITCQKESWGGPKPHPYIKIGTYNPNKKYLWYEDNGYAIAWMPLPEPYQMEASE